MDEIEKRLRETTDACITSFEAWIKNNKNLESREALMESMHEVRKVISRVEIEIAISERDRLGARPLPIPPHRSSRRPNETGDEDMGGDVGNDLNDHDSAQPSSNSGNDGRRHQHQGGGHRSGRRPLGGGGGGHQLRGQPNNNDKPQG
jgi:hypothetical protein